MTPWTTTKYDIRATLMFRNRFTGVTSTRERRKKGVTKFLTSQRTGNVSSRFVEVADVNRGYPKFRLHKRSRKNTLSLCPSLLALLDTVWKRRPGREDKREKASRIMERSASGCPYNRTVETEYKGQRHGRHLVDRR